MKGKVLVFCEGIWLGRTARPLAIAGALRSAGWDVEFAASGVFTRLVVAEGFPVHPVATMDPESALASVRSLRVEYDRALIETYVEDELTVLKRTRPDFVLNDFRLPASISCRLARVPLVNILNAYSTNFYAPARRAPGDLFLTRVLGQRLSSSLMPFIMRVALSIYARPFSAAAVARGLAPFGNIFDVMASPDLNLVCDLPEFMPLAGAPPNFREVGPIIWEPSVPAPPWLETIDPDRPTIYFTMGSTGLEHYYKILKAAFAGTSFQVLITTGGVTDPGRLPENFHAASLAPALSILEKSDLVVCHGGNGTIYQALSKGVPILAIPTFHDQDFNAQRVVDLGVGDAILPRDLTANALRHAVEKLLGDEKANAAAASFAATISTVDALKSSVAAIERFLANRRT
jgi:MGT family glycosyltransferase